MKMIVTRKGQIIGEVTAQDDTFGGKVWDAHAINPATGGTKFLGTFTKEHGKTAMDVLNAAETAIKKHKWNA